MTFKTLSIEQLKQRHGIKWRRFGEDVIGAWIADMDFPLADPLRRSQQSMIDRDDSGYPLHAENDPLPAVLVERMQQRYGWKPREDLINILVDVVQGLYVAVDRFSEQGDGVVMQTPIYHPFLGLVNDLQRCLVANPLQFSSQGWDLDVDHLAGCIDSNTRILMFCSPHNPSGRVWTRTELEAIAELVLKHDLIVLADEIHADLTYPGHQHIPFASLSAEIEARTVTFTSATKSFNIAGWRCALAIFGSEALKKRFDSFPRRFMGGLGCGVTEFTRVAWSECADWHVGLMDYLDGNRKLIGDFLRDELPAVNWHSPQSTYLAWLDFNAYELPEDPQCFFLREAKVALSPGPQFGAPGKGCARLNFATDRKILLEILTRLRNALKQ